MPDGRAKARQALYVPLRITAWLQTPVVSDALLPIDAVLYYAAHRELYGERIASHPGALIPSEHREQALVPLAICEGHTPTWYYAASSAQWPTETVEGTDHWTCRFDAGLSDLIDLPHGRINTASGRYRGYHMPVFYRSALSVWWYVRGNRETITRLLRLVSHLGKKTSQGWGAVLRWQVEPIEQDWSVTGPSGECMRPIPASDGDMLAGYRPPYWVPSRQTICRMPR